MQGEGLTLVAVGTYLTDLLMGFEGFKDFIEEIGPDLSWALMSLES